MSVFVIAILCSCLLPEAARACFGGGASSGTVTCPQIVNETTFDSEKFTGQWYGVYTSDEAESKMVKCSNVYFSAISDGFQAFFANSTDNKETVGGKKYKQDSSMNHNFEVTNVGACGFKPSSIPMQTIATDYQSYAMLYSCVVKDNALVEHTLLLSRNKALSDDVKNVAVAGTKVPLYALSQSDCGC